MLDADNRGYFDTIDHQWMREVPRHWIGDQRVMRLTGLAESVSPRTWNPTMKSRAYIERKIPLLSFGVEQSLLKRETK
jgi:hypothetical protein